MQGWIESLPNDEDLTMQFKLTNIGHSPAIHVRIEAQIIQVVYTDLYPQLQALQKNFCDKASTKNIEYEAPFTLFPNDPAVKPSPELFLKPNVGMTHFRYPPWKDFMSPAVVGCVIYQFTFNSKLRQTGFIYLLHKVGWAVMPNIIYPSEMIPASQLAISPWPQDTSAID